MQAQIKQWGDGLALRIPRVLALDANLRRDEYVDVSIENGCIVITPIKAKTDILDALLEGVTESNLHGEVDTGAPLGKEVW